MITKYLENVIKCIWEQLGYRQKLREKESLRNFTLEQQEGRQTYLLKQTTQKEEQVDWKIMFCLNTINFMCLGCMEVEILKKQDLSGLTVMFQVAQSQQYFMDSFMNWIKLKKNQVSAGGLECHRLLIAVFPLLLLGQMGSGVTRCMPDCLQGPLDWEWA